MPLPPFLGSRVRTDFDMREVFNYLNELTLFSTQWQFNKGGVKPAEYAKQIAEVARPALARLKELCLAENILRPAVDVRLLPRRQRRHQTHRLRGRPPHAACRHSTSRARTSATSSASAITSSRRETATAVDYVAFMAVTMGREVTKLAQSWYEAGKYQDYLYLHGLGVESAEALAEYFHQQAAPRLGHRRRGFAAKSRSSSRATIAAAATRSAIRRARISKTRSRLFDLIDPTRVGITLSEQFQLEPEQSTTAIVMHHPEAKYFNVSRVSNCSN